MIVVWLSSLLCTSFHTGGISDAHGLVESSEDSIEFYGATVVTPGNATLVHDLSLKLPQGVNLLVTGPNGAGKSSLFRVLGGLWPLHQGTIKKPGLSIGETGLSHEIFYVPQRPYVAAGTLQEQLLYPLSPSGRLTVGLFFFFFFSNETMGQNYVFLLLL